MERPGMMIYLNVWERLQRRLSYEQLGRLLSAMLDVLGGQPPQPMDDDPALALAFDMVSDLQERDAELVEGEKLFLERYDVDDFTKPLLKRIYAFVLLFKELFEEYDLEFDTLFPDPKQTEFNDESDPQD